VAVVFACKRDGLEDFGLGFQEMMDSGFHIELLSESRK
jgi:hypothetical protein